MEGYGNSACYPPPRHCHVDDDVRMFRRRVNHNKYQVRAHTEAFALLNISNRRTIQAQSDPSRRRPADGSPSLERSQRRLFQDLTIRGRAGCTRLAPRQYSVRHSSEGDCLRASSVAGMHIVDDGLTNAIDDGLRMLRHRLEHVP
jgi:hypothetical protein